MQIRCMIRSGSSTWSHVLSIRVIGCALYPVTSHLSGEGGDEVDLQKPGGEVDVNHVVQAHQLEHCALMHGIS